MARRRLLRRLNRSGRSRGIFHGAERRGARGPGAGGPLTPLAMRRCGRSLDSSVVSHVLKLFLRVKNLACLRAASARIPCPPGFAGGLASLAGKNRHEPDGRVAQAGRSGVRQTNCHRIARITDATHFNLPPSCPSAAGRWRAGGRLAPGHVDGTALSQCDPGQGGRPAARAPAVGSTSQRPRSGGGSARAGNLRHNPMQREDGGGRAAAWGDGRRGRAAWGRDAPGPGAGGGREKSGHNPMQQLPPDHDPVVRTARERRRRGPPAGPVGRPGIAMPPVRAPVVAAKNSATTPCNVRTARERRRRGPPAGPVGRPGIAMPPVRAPVVAAKNPATTPCNVRTARERRRLGPPAGPVGRPGGAMPPVRAPVVAAKNPATTPCNVRTRRAGCRLGRPADPKPRPPSDARPAAAAPTGATNRATTPCNVRTGRAGCRLGRRADPKPRPPSDAAPAAAAPTGATNRATTPCNVKTGRIDCHRGRPADPKPRPPSAAAPAAAAPTGATNRATTPCNVARRASRVGRAARPIAGGRTAGGACDQRPPARPRPPASQPARPEREKPARRSARVAVGGKSPGTVAATQAGTAVARRAVSVDNAPARGRRRPMSPPCGTPSRGRWRRKT